MSSRILPRVSVVGGSRSDVAVIVETLDPIASVTAMARLPHAAPEAHLLVVVDARLVEPALAHAGSRMSAAPILAVIADSAPALPPRLAAAVDDFVVLPVRGDELRVRAERLLACGPPERDAHARLTEAMALRQLVGSAPALREVTDAIPALAGVGAPVLVIGETGTGKELCARAIHFCGPRRGHAFVPVDCSAIPDHLFENELFGHARGAFTDAHADRRGLAALAHGGTLFLDEIDALSMRAQAKLLRLLEDGSFKPLGAEQFSRADFGLVAATNADLEARIAERTFRSDLYYRLNILRLRLPPLRERRSDVACLAEHFLRAFAASTSTPLKRLAPAALRALFLYDWPGNVRELRNVVYRAAAIAPGPQILPVHLGFPGPAASEAPGPGSFKAAKAQAVQAFERTFIEDLLKRHGGNVTRAARDAQQDRRVFGRLMKKHRLARTSD